MDDIFGALKDVEKQILTWRDRLIDDCDTKLNDLLLLTSRRQNSGCFGMTEFGKESTANIIDMAYFRGYIVGLEYALEEIHYEVGLLYQEIQEKKE